MKSATLKNSAAILLGLFLFETLLFIGNSHSRLPEQSRVFYKSRTILVAAYFIEQDDPTVEPNPYLKEFFEYVRDNLDSLSEKTVFLMIWVNYFGALTILLTLCKKMKKWFLILSLFLVVCLLLLDILVMNNP